MRFIYKTVYEQDIKLFRHEGQMFWYSVLVVALLVAPWFVSSYVMTQISQIYIYSIIGLGLVLLTGFTGQLSIGHAAFVGVGAYTEAVLAIQGVPFYVSIFLSAALAGVVGVVVGLPALRIKGLYLAIATLAFSAIIEEVIAQAAPITGGNLGLRVPAIDLFGYRITGGAPFYYLAMFFVIASVVVVLNLLRSPTGRAFIAIRDSELSAQSMGVNLAFYKTLSFACSAALAGLAGGLYAHNLRFLSPDQFSVFQSIEYVMMVVIGGVASLHGAIFGAVFLVVLPQVINAIRPYLPEALAQATGLQPTLFGAALVAVILLEPKGIAGSWIKVRTYFELFPLYRKGQARRQKAFQKSERLK